MTTYSLPASSTADAATRTLVLFSIAGQRYALGCEDVEEVIRAVAVAELRGAPGLVEGVVDLRGRIIPVFDLRRRLGIPPRSIDLRDHFVIVRAPERLVALRTDGPASIAGLDAATITGAATVTPGIPVVAGVVTLPDGIVLIADLAAFLSHAEAKALNRALESANAGTPFA